MTGHLVKTLKRALAHEFSHKLSQLVRRGYHTHAALGHWSGGTPPYGYRRAIARAGEPLVALGAGRWKARGERVLLIVDSVEAAIVREMHEGYAHGGLGVLAIAQRPHRAGQS